MTPVLRRWILSPERLYLDCWTRYFLREHLDPTQIRDACNVGIGPGEFDDWLGLLLPEQASLTSVDIDHRVVSAHAIRQERLGHPNPSRVVHGDLMQLNLGPFDLVTVVGSTINETHAPARALEVAQSWVRPGGLLYATIVHSMVEKPDLLIAELRGEITVQRFEELEEAGFTAVLARQPGTLGSSSP